MALDDLMQIPEFKKFRSREETFDFMDEIANRNGLPPERWKELLDLTDAVYGGVIHVKDMPELIAQAFGIEGRQLQKVLRELIAVQIAPMKDVVPGLAAQIAEWGTLAPSNTSAIETYEEYAETLAARANSAFSLLQVRRLAYLLRLYLTNARTHEQTMAFFVRKIAIGGLGLTEEQAAIVLQFVDEEKGRLQLVDEAPRVIPEAEGEEDEQETSEEVVDVAEDDYTDAVALAHRPELVADTVAAPEAHNVLEIAPSHALATETPVAAKPPEAKSVRAGFILPTHEDAAEIAVHEKKMERAQMSATDDVRLEAAVEAAVNVAAPTLAKAGAEKQKFADIARMAIKGVRDPYQTRAIIERDFGITGEPVLELIEAVMQGMDAYNVGAGFIPPTHNVPPPLPPPISESAVMDRRFAAVAGEMPTSSVEPIMEEARVSAARSKEEELHEQASRVDPAKLEAAAASTKPAPATAMLTVGSMPPPPPGEMPMVTDVQFKPRLVGPVEELGTMQPADFRRLSSNADEAARKVQDLLHALEATSYEDRIRGVQAWRQNPVSKLYGQMAAEALNNGITLVEVASRRRNKGEESLTPAELRAVANINAAIRF